MRHAGARRRGGRGARAADLLAPGGEPGQRERLGLPQVSDLGALAGDALGESALPAFSR